MSIRASRALLCLFFVPLVVASNGFPKDFIWGTATAAYQVEGAWNVSGRGLSIWDVFSHTPGKTANGDTGDVADDQYFRYLEDIGRMKQQGWKNFRLSLSWSRILPTGEAPVNQAGIDHYNALINALVEAGIEPYVTLYHWDLPQELHQKYGGWLSKEVSVRTFARYADVCFASFGDRVKNWITFNEVLTFAVQGYGSGTHAPGRCSNRTACSAGNSSVEPYIVAHSVLNAHAAAVNIYRTKYQPTQKGRIGITLNCDWSEPLDPNSKEDLAATQRHLEFQLAWFADPVYFGDYPASMKTLVGARLPQFTPAEKSLLKGSADVFFLNHYTSAYATPARNLQLGEGWDVDQNVATTFFRNGVPIGPAADSPWLYVVPFGIRKMVGWVFQRYGKPEIIVTENGVDVPHESTIPFPEVLNDTFRVEFYKGYIDNLRLALTEDNVLVKGYFAWSFMDNFEWADGYAKRFGIHYVDYKNNITRHEKQSSKWFQQLINDNGL